MTDATSPVIDFLIARLSAVPELSGLTAEDQIRVSSDQSDPPVGAAAIVVSATDKGNHLDIPERILVDVQASVEVRTSLTDDPAMSVFSVISKAAFSALCAIQNDTSISGWFIRFGSDWQSGEVMQDALYRYQEFSGTILLQSNPPNEE